MIGALPRRGSISSSDAAYDPYLARVRQRIDVRLNGRVVVGFIGFDCDEGWVRSLRYRYAKQGHATLAVRKGIALEQLLYGAVSVRWC